MRVLILSLILLVPLSSNAFAMNAGDLYRYCKPYADRAFKVENNDDLLCIMYFRGVADSYHRLCSNMKAALSAVGEESSLAPGLFSVQRIEGIGMLTKNSFSPVIQSFVNEMSSKPEDWLFSPVQSVHSSLKKIIPCR